MCKHSLIELKMIMYIIKSMIVEANTQCVMCNACTLRSNTPILQQIGKGLIIEIYVRIFDRSWTFLPQLKSSGFNVIFVCQRCDILSFH